MDYFFDKMKTEYSYKHKITWEDVLFWIVIAGMVGIALWLLSGSPTEIGAIIGIVTFAAASDILIWRKIFSAENKTSISFLRLRNEMDKKFMQIEHKLENNNTLLLNKLDSIENKLRRK